MWAQIEEKEQCGRLEKKTVINTKLPSGRIKTRYKTPKQQHNYLISPKQTKSALNQPYHQ